LKSKVTSEPAVEPVTLTELKSSLKITNTAEDTLLTQYIVDAREMVERFTSRKLITQTLVGYALPYSEHHRIEEFEGYRMGAYEYLTGQPSHIQFDWGPVQSVTTVETVDTQNSESTYASTNYYLDNYDEDLMPRVVYNDDSVYPTSLRTRDSWKVTYIAGYGDAGSDVPSDIRRAIIMLAGYLWGNRGACPDGKCVNACGASGALEKFRLASILS
jgi:hypothetical protein